MMRGIWEEYMEYMGGEYGDIDIFLGDWTCTCCNISSVLGRNEASFADGLLRARHQQIFIDHHNDNRWRVSRDRDVLVCEQQRNHHTWLSSRWLRWKYFNRPLVQQIWNEPRGASATAHNPNTFKKYSWGCIWEIQLRNTVEKYGAPQLLITVSIGRRKSLWGARYLFAARPHTGEYSEYQIQLYIFLLRYWNIFPNCLRVHWRRGMWFGPVWQQSKIWDMQLLLSTTHSRWEIHLGNTEKYIWVMQFWQQSM